MKLKVFQKGFNYSQDGPGNRLVYHLQGCNMRCPWCANPESIPIDGVVGNPKDKDKESSLSYFELDLKEIIEEVEDSRVLFFDQGGVTFTGGEPTIQFKELLILLQELYERKIHTTIETNATHGRLEELFPYLSMLIIDFKHIDDRIHQSVIKSSNEQVKKNIIKAAQHHKKLLIRTPLINNFNADKKYIEPFISFYKQFDCSNIKFEFLKYHEYGKVKWEQCGLEYEIKDGFVTDQLREAFENEYRNAGLQVIRT